MGKTSRTASPATAPARRSFARSLSHVFISLLLGPLAAFITAPLLARALGQDGRGELAAANAPVLFTTAVLTFGLGEAGTYFVARNRHENQALARRVLLLFAGLGLLAGLATWAVSPLLAAGNEDLQAHLVISALLTPPTFLVFGLRAVASGAHAFALQARESFVTNGLRLVVIAVLFATGELTVFSAVLVMLLSPLAGGLVLLPVLRRLPRSGAVGPPRYRDLFGYGHRIWLGALSGIVLSRVDQLLMVPLSGEQELGLYAVAVSIGELPTVVAAGVRAVVFSADAADAEADAERSAARLQMLSRLTSTATAVVAVPLIAVLPWALPVVFGQDFERSLLPSAILVLATVAGSAGSVAGSGLSARGRPGLRSLSMLFAAVANMAVFFAAVPHCGALGAALATLVGAWVAGTANVFWLRKAFGMPFAAFYGLRRSDVSLVLSTVRRRSGVNRAP